MEISNISEKQNVMISGKKQVVFVVSGGAFLFFFLSLILGIFVPQNKEPFAGTPRIQETVEIAGDLSSIVVEALGENEEKALENAKRQALEKKLGAWIVYDTIVENFVLIKEKITSRLEGYISDLKVLSSKPKEKEWKVRIECKVNSKKISQTILGDIQEFRSLFGYRRVVVIKPEGLEPIRQAGVNELVLCLENALLEKGFRVFKKSFAQAQFQAMIARLKQFPLLSELQKEENSFVVFVDLEKRESKEQDLLKVNAQANNFGRKYVSLPSVFYPVARLQDALAWEKGAQICSEKWIPVLLQSLIKQISCYGAGRECLLYFSGLSQEDQPKMPAILNSMKEQKQLLWIGDFSHAEGMMAVDISSNSDPVAQIHSNMMHAGIPSYSYRLDNLVIFHKVPLWLWYVRQYSMQLTLCITISLVVAFYMFLRFWKARKSLRRN